MIRIAYSAVLVLCGMSNALAQSASVSSDSVKAGAQVFHRWCVECHAAGPHPGTAALERRYQGAIPAALEQRTAAELPDALIRLTVRNGMSYMPFFRKTEVTDRELDALVAYLTSDRALRAQAFDQTTNRSPK